MQRRQIGSLSVSVVGIGCNNFGGRIDEEATRLVVDAALDEGINFFDTADMYSAGRSEEFLGRALGSRRKDVVIATKFGHLFDGKPTGASPEHIKKACEDSLRRLGTDTIDLYQLHIPDKDTPIADTLGALEDLVRAGKVREIGCSNFSADQLQEAAAAVRPGAARFVSVQNELSLLKREPEAEVLPECKRKGLAFLPYFPLASGMLTGKYRRGAPHPEGTRIKEDSRWMEDIDEVDRLMAFAESKGHTLLELAFGWLLAHEPVASVIAGATKPDQVRANVRAAGWIPSIGELTGV